MYDNGNYIEHYGTKGMKWGIRRFQEEDGTLTAEGKERYYENQGRTARSSETFGSKFRSAASKAGQYAKAQVRKKIDQKRGKNPVSDLNDDELNARLVRMRKEAEYTRLQREINGTNQNNGGGGKGDKKHPLLSKAVTMPIAAAIGVGVAAVSKEKVSAFLDHRADKKLSAFMKAAKSSTNENALGSLFESARRAASTAGHEIKGAVNIKNVVDSNLGKKASAVAVKNAGKVKDFMKRTTLDAPILKRRMGRLNQYL